MRFNISTPKAVSRPGVKLAVKPKFTAVAKGVVKGEAVRGKSYPYPIEEWPTVETYDVSAAIDTGELAGTVEATWAQPNPGMTAKFLMAPFQVGDTPPAITEFVEFISVSADALTLTGGLDGYVDEFGLPEVGDYIPYAIQFTDELGRKYAPVIDVVQVAAA